MEKATVETAYGNRTPLNFKESISPAFTPGMKLGSGLLGLLLKI